MTSGRPASHAVHVRAFEQSDLDGAAALWSEASSRHQPAVFPLAEVVNALAADNMGLIAERDGTLIGAAVVQLLRDHAWVLRLAVIADESGESVCDALLAGLINELAARGAR
ncbi:MAG: hypothetical protein M3Q38_04955, partial [Chloroflexota bacterium]|nr:hypothetical protein [Chloroflexota bacterium]